MHDEAEPAQPGPSLRMPEDAAGSAEPGRRTWRTYAEIRAATAEKPRQWLVPNLLPLGGLVVVAGYAKRSGKSTLAWALAAARERGGTFLGASLDPGPVVIVAEDADLDMADRMERFGFPTTGGCVLSRGAVRGGWTIEGIAREAGERARRIGARVVIVDTFLHWARLEPKAENDSGAVAEALRPLQALVDELGALVLVVHHAGKNAENEGGYAGRGTSAFAGIPETTLSLHPVGGVAHPERRRLVIDSRVAAVGLREVVIELRQPAGAPWWYDRIGDAAALAREEVDGRILDWFRGPGLGRWHTRDEVAKGVHARGGDALKALPRLYHEHRVQRIGHGRPGAPHRYAALGTPPPPDAEAGGESVPAVPHRSPSVPGNGAGVRRAESVPAVPRGSIEPGNGNGPPAPPADRRMLARASTAPGTDIALPGRPDPASTLDDPSACLNPDGSTKRRRSQPACCPKCGGPTRRAGKVRRCAGRCAQEAGPGGLAPVVRAGEGGA